MLNVSGEMSITVEELLSKHEAEFTKFYELYAAYNAHTNISAIRDRDGVYTKHFADSLMSLPYIEKYWEASAVNPDHCTLMDAKSESKNSLRILDIGTGGGFPAVPLAIVLRGLPVTIIALDSVGKKTKFVELVKNELGLENLLVLRMRAEDLLKAKEAELGMVTAKRGFDFVMTRAVMALSETLRTVAPLLKNNGLYIAYKKSDIDAEIQSAKGIAVRTKLELVESHAYDSKQLLIYKKY